MNKKLKTFLIMFCVCVFGIYGLYCALCLFADSKLPDTRTLYLSYNSFYKSAKQNTFMEQLPESASRKKYFHQNYFFHDRDGYGAVYSEEEYEAAKLTYLQQRWEYINEYVRYIYTNGKEVERTEAEKAKRIDEWNPYSMDDTTEQEPDMATVFEKYNINFFDLIAREDMEEGNYHFVWCWERDYTSNVMLDCVIYNDETHEIIEIACCIKSLG